MPLPKLPPLPLDVVRNFHVPLSWGVSDPARFMALLDEARSLVLPGYHLGDNLFTWGRNNSFLEDPAFVESWQRNALNDADEAIAWRRYILACSAAHAVNLPGDFVECGVYIGSGIKTVMDYLGGVSFPKVFWGYDTYDYNPVEGHSFAGQEAGLYDAVCARFAEYPQVKLVRGLVPESFREGCPESVAYLHVDMNNAAGEIAALDVLFDRVVPGGLVILDDYEWAMAYRGQKAQEDPWFEARGYRVFPLPTGQGFVIKR